MAQIQRDWACNKRTDAQTTAPRAHKTTCQRVNDDKPNQVDLDKIVFDFASTRYPSNDSNGNKIEALDYWKYMYAMGEKKDGLTLLALEVFSCP
ncbi:hypothetical protein JCM5296_005641, partial [Sporobolomyces johnsonii]